MLIHDLKKNYFSIYKLALNNQEVQGNKRNHFKSLHQDKDQGNFNWNSSLEGREFWVKIYNRYKKTLFLSNIDNFSII